MDINGLEHLIRANHEALSQRFDGLEESFSECRTVRVSCASRIDGVERRVILTEKFIDRIKTIGAVFGALWTIPAGERIIQFLLWLKGG